jgi:flagellar hook assembly protein FlgD
LQRLLSTATIVGLLIATAAAFAVTERLKLTKSPITSTIVSKVFSPTCGCATGKATIRFKLRRGDVVDVTVDGPGGTPVRLLAVAERFPAGRVVFRWNGMTDTGVRAPDGIYRVQIHLVHQHRTILLPNKILLDTVPPEVLSATANRQQFSPDDDRQADSVTVSYTLSEQAHVIVYLDGTRIVRTRFAKERNTFSWDGVVHKQLLPPGTYTLSVGAVDLAGNATPVARRARILVQIRYIVLASHRIAGVAAGRKFDIGVSTDAKHYSWTLGARSGVATGPDLVLRAPAKPGRYELKVTERGHSDSAVVVVG